MEIGTPLLEGAKKLLWLGGGELGKESVPRLFPGGIL